jgi:hypothetical protein
MLKFLYTRKLNIKLYESMTSRFNKKNIKTMVRPIKENFVVEELAVAKESPDTTKVNNNFWKNKIVIP